MPVAVLLRGDHDLNEIKLKKVLGCEELEMATDEQIVKATGAPVGYLGPIGQKIRLLPIRRSRGCGILSVVPTRMAITLKTSTSSVTSPLPEFADIRNVTHGDPCPRCSGGILEMWRGIEVGHVFKLGIKYSKALNATFLDPDGKEQIVFMGCYGIGIGRTVAACIEQNHDDNGIIFPLPIAPFHCIISAVNPKDAEVSRVSGGDLCNRLLQAGVEVLLR